MICEPCGQDADDDLDLCGRCLSRLIAVVRDIPDMLRTLVTTIHKRSKMGGTGGGDNFSQPLPINMGALKVQTDLQQAYRDLFTYLHKAFPDPVGNRTEDVAAFISDYMPCVQVLPDAVYWYQRILGVYGKAQATADRPTERVTLGVCGKILEGPVTEEPWGWNVLTCPQPLSVPRGRTAVVCPACTTLWVVKDRQTDAYEAANEAVAYAAVIVRALASQGIKASLVDINDWQNRTSEALLAVEVDDKGRKLFRFSDVYRFAAKARRRKARS